MSLEVIKAIGLVTIQGARRIGRMHEGLSHGGPLVPSLATRALDSDDGTVIEICGRLVVRATQRMRIATDRIPGRVIEPGDEIDIASDPMRVTYLAVGGGLIAPGAHLSAGIGALVRTGDRIDVGTPRDANTARDDNRAAHPDAPIRVIAGPDLDAFAPGALAALCAGTYRISPSSDRVGTRLDGPPLQRRERYVEQSRPMVLGAIEVPRDGAPIVLGPEHPTTGGYPILAVVASDSLDAFHSIRLGGLVRFV